jgi:hypothetical protein
MIEQVNAPADSERYCRPTEMSIGGSGWLRKSTGHRGSPFLVEAGEEICLPNNRSTTTPSSSQGFGDKVYEEREPSA